MPYPIYGKGLCNKRQSQRRGSTSSSSGCWLGLQKLRNSTLLSRNEPSVHLIISEAGGQASQLVGDKYFIVAALKCSSNNGLARNSLLCLVAWFFYCFYTSSEWLLAQTHKNCPRMVLLGPSRGRRTLK